MANQAGGVFDPSRDVEFTGVVTVSGTLAASGTATGPSGATLVTATGTQTLTNKTLTAPTVTAPVVSGAYTLAPIVVTASADGAVTITATALTVVKITKSGVCAITLADPGASLEGAVVVFNSQTASAHTVTNTTGFNGAGAGGDVATFGGAVGDGFAIVAINQKWNVIVLRNVTLG